MRRIFSVTPIHVDESELERRRRRYRALAPEGIIVELDDVGAAAPKQLATEADLRASESAVLSAMAGRTSEHYDAVLPDCVLDPGITAGPDTGAPPRPQGMLKLVMAELAAAGHRVAAVTRNAVIGAELDRKVREYGFGEVFRGVAVLDLGVESLADSRAWNTAISGAAGDLGARGATAVINGCSAVDVTVSDGQGPLIVDPAVTALSVLARKAHR